MIKLLGVFCLRGKHFLNSITVTLQTKQTCLIWTAVHSFNFSIFSHSSLAAPSIHLTRAPLHVLSLHLTNQILPWTLSGNHTLYSLLLAVMSGIRVTLLHRATPGQIGVLSRISFWWFPTITKLLYHEMPFGFTTYISRNKLNEQPLLTMEQAFYRWHGAWWP